MDRLEKALEKSRQQRASLGAQQSQPTPDQGVFAPLPQDANAISAGSSLTQSQEDLLERNRIVAHKPRCTEADAYRLLRTQVLQIMKSAGFKTLAITSPDYGDGKTTVAINLALSISQDIKQTVLIADLDLRKPNLHQYLGIDTNTGLTDHILKGIPLQDCIVKPGFDRISVLPAGSVQELSSELLGAPKMISLAHELKTRYPDRFVIYDMPPVLAQDDSIAFLPHVDAVLVVVREGVTNASRLRRCLQTLAGANVIGTVLNDCL